MRCSSLVAVLFVLMVAGVAAADTPFNDYSSVPPGTPPGPAGGQTTQAGNTEALAFYNDRTAFQVANPGLTVEDFSGTSVPPDGVLACDPPFNELTSNDCFSQGAITSGVSVELIPNVDSSLLNVVLTPAFFDLSCVAVGPNTFSDDSSIDFNPAVRAVGLDLVSPIAGAVPFDIEIFGPGGSLGTTSAFACLNEPCFWGVDSNDIGGITSVVFTSAAGDGELFCNVEFGGEPVPVELQSFDVE